MEAPDRSKHVYYLLAVGALLVTVVGGLTGIVNKHVPREAVQVNITSAQHSLNAYATDLQDTVGADRVLGLDFNLAKFRIHNIPQADQPSHRQRMTEKHSN
jgi:hypothetical protein